MSARWKKYLTVHLVLAAIALGFGAYAVLTSLLFPNGFFHCILHDLLHLYCPFCGGTRAFLALLHFDVPAALRLNAAVLFAVLVLIVLDVRALVLLFRKKEGVLLPPGLGRIAILYFSVYMLALNTAMLYGFDPAGDLASYWQAHGSPLGRALFLPLMALVLILFWIAIEALPVRCFSRYRPTAAWLSSYLLVTLLGVLYATWPLLLLYVPITVGLICYLIFKRKRRRT